MIPSIPAQRTAPTRPVGTKRARSLPNVLGTPKLVPTRPATAKGSDYTVSNSASRPRPATTKGSDYTQSTTTPQINKHRRLTHSYWAETEEQHREQQAAKSQKWMDRRGLGSHLMSSEERGLIKTWFKMLDSNGDGELSVKEVFDTLIATGCSNTSGQVDSIVQRLDANGDGVVDLDEFLRVFQSASSADMECATQLRKVISKLKSTIQSIDPVNQLDPALAVSIARRKAVMELMENVYSTDNKKLIKIQRLKIERQHSYREKNKLAMRRTTRQLNRLMEETDAAKQSARTLALLVPDAIEILPALSQVACN